jgi:hypothetical protein
MSAACASSGAVSCLPISQPGWCAALVLATLWHLERQQPPSARGHISGPLEYSAFAPEPQRSPAFGRPASLTATEVASGQQSAKRVVEQRVGADDRTAAARSAAERSQLNPVFCGRGSAWMSTMAGEGARVVRVVRE